MIFDPPEPSYELKEGGQIYTTRDGTPVYRTPIRGSLVYLYFKGNSMDLGPLCDSLPQMAEVLDCTIYSVEYPGYGALKKSSKPSERGLFNASDALWKHVTEECLVHPHKIVVWGFSLGSLCASHLAQKYPFIHGVILESAFASGMNVLSPHLSSVSRVLHKMPIRVPFSNTSILSAAKNPRWRFCMFHGKLDDIVADLHIQELRSVVPRQNFRVGMVFPESGHLFSSKDFMVMLLQIRHCMEDELAPVRN